MCCWLFLFPTINFIGTRICHIVHNGLQIGLVFRRLNNEKFKTMYKKYLKESNKSDDKQNFPDYITWLNNRLLRHKELLYLRNNKPKN